MEKRPNIDLISRYVVFGFLCIFIGAFGGWKAAPQCPVTLFSDSDGYAYYMFDTPQYPIPEVHIDRLCLYTIDKYGIAIETKPNQNITLNIQYYGRH